jgi:hypothetical protein
MKYLPRPDPAKRAARLERNANQLVAILQGGGDVPREEIIERLGIKSLSGLEVRLTTARQMGYRIDCENNGGHGMTWYRLVV